MPPESTLKDEIADILKDAAFVEDRSGRLEKGLGFHIGLAAVASSLAGWAFITFCKEYFGHLIKRLAEGHAEETLERLRLLIKSAKNLIANRKRLSDQQEAEVFTTFYDEIKQLQDSAPEYATLMTSKDIEAAVRDLLVEHGYPTHVASERAEKIVAAIESNIKGQADIHTEK
jgi:hypothetical protein